MRTIWVEERKARASHQALKAAVRVDSFAARPLADTAALPSALSPFMQRLSRSRTRRRFCTPCESTGVPVLQGCHYWADAESNLVLDATSSTPQLVWVSRPRPYIPRAPLSQEEFITSCFPASAQPLHISIHKATFSPSSPHSFSNSNAFVCACQHAVQGSYRFGLVRSGHCFS